MERLEECAAAAVADLDVAAVYLFGSRAAGTARPDSDYDVAVLFRDGVDALSRLDVTGALQGRLSRDLGVAVDVVDLNGAPDILASQVLRHGRLLVRRDESARIRHEVALRQRVMDFEHYRGLYAARMIEHMAGGETRGGPGRH